MLPTPKVAQKRKVLPGIEPGLPEDTEMIRIRSDNRYLCGGLVFWIEEIRVDGGLCLHYRTQMEQVLLSHLMWRFWCGGFILQVK
jgi:hypothetical protein